MRFRAPAVFGLAVAVSMMAGCAANRRPSSNDQAWLWKAPTSATSYDDDSIAASPYNPYSAVVQNPGALGTRPNEFTFTHPRVDSFVARFQTNLRGFFSGALERSGRYVPRMSSILAKEGVPPELAYLPLIESGFRTHAVSRAGAVGPWQLIPGTGRRYGLRIDRYVDERCDPVKSTQAAARYLKDLHDMFGNWHLSLAAYNTGEQNIARILEKGRAENFWQMRERGYLYEETADFVPEFLAALHIAKTPEAYGFDAPNEEPMRYDLVNVKRPLPLSTVAKLCGTSTDTIKELNPALHRGIVPPQGYDVRLPKGSKETFEVAYANLETLPEPPRVRTGVSQARRSGHQGRHVRGRGAPSRHRNGRATHVVAAGEQRDAPVVLARRKVSRVLD
jgi:transglycosylase-like protein with SLT domain